MKREEEFSEEQVNAFVDDELDPEEKSRLYNASTRSTELDRQLCQHRKLKELVKHSYGNVPTPSRSRNPALSQRGFLGQALAASILIVIGITGGFLVHDYLRHGDGVLAASGQPVAQVNNYLLHVTSSQPDQMLAALQQAEKLLEESAEDGELRQVEIIANEQGLDLLRSDVTPFAREISALQDRDVVFYACSRTIERLEEHGVDVKLVPHINASYSALDRVVSRMQEGWHYEKI